LRPDALGAGDVDGVRAAGEPVDGDRPGGWPDPAGFDERAGLAGHGEVEGVAGGLGGRDMDRDGLPGQRELGCVDPHGDRLGGPDDDAGGQDAFHLDLLYPLPPGAASRVPAPARAELGFPADLFGAAFFILVSASMVRPCRKSPTV
jgi:hypothetical protein